MICSEYVARTKQDAILSAFYVDLDEVDLLYAVFGSTRVESCCTNYFSVRACRTMSCCRQQISISVAKSRVARKSG
jgi:hypothetical protein